MVIMQENNSNGLLLLSDSQDKLKIVFVEAKDQSNGGIRSLKMLKKTLLKLKFKTSKNPLFTTIKTSNAKGVYSILELDGKLNQYSI